MLKYAKIIDETTKQCEVGLGTNSDFYKSIGMTEIDVEQAFNGNWYLIGYAPEKPLPTDEEQKENRARAYQAEVDPITSHIQRLRDEEQTEETIAKINELIEERNAKVEEIKERYPYMENTDDNLA